MQGLPKIGDVLDGTYEIEELIGTGGFGAVYRARQISMNRDVALKVLVAHAMKVEEMIQRFRREVMAVRNLGHPNTIRIYDFMDRPDGVLYYAMEYVKGPTLKECIEEGPMPPDRVRRILRQVLKSLAEAHSFGIVHRDLKPANIMIADIPGETDFVKVVDFGIAKIIGGDGEEEREQLTNAGVLVGTLNYMSPEQIAGGEIGPESDLYALGLIGIEMLMGKSVFEGTGRWEILHKQISDEPVEIPTAVDNSELGAVFRAALKKRPPDRYQRAQDMLSALDELGALSSEPIFDPSDEPAEDGAPAGDPQVRRLSHSEDVQPAFAPAASEPQQQAVVPSGPSLPTGSSPGTPHDTAPLSPPEPVTAPRVESPRDTGPIQSPDRQPITSPVNQATPTPSQTSAPQKAFTNDGETGIGAVPDTGSSNKSLIVIAAIAMALVAVLGSVVLMMAVGSDDAQGAEVASPVPGPDPDPGAPTTAQGTEGLAEKAAEPTEPAEPSQLPEEGTEDPAGAAHSVRLLTPGVEAQVFEGDDLLGSTPLRFPVREEKTYTLRADGFEVATVELGPESDEVVDVRMTREATPTKKRPSEKPVQKSRDKPRTEPRRTDDGWVDVPVTPKKKTSDEKKPPKKSEVPVF